MDPNYWHKKKQKKFLKNIDTFYYAVYMDEDFNVTNDRSTESASSLLSQNNVNRFRNFCERLSKENEAHNIYLDDDTFVLYQPGSFSIYTVRLTKPGLYDLFLAPRIFTDDTPVMIMQIRSRALWEDGVYEAFFDSLAIIRILCKRFNLHIKEIKENRCDFACHSNYLTDPESFFEEKHFVKMWVGTVGRNGKEKTKQFLSHCTVYDDDTIEKDYIALGKRGDKCFIRIYLKSKEVVQEGYKGFFLKLWYLNGMISRYDLYCLEEAYKKKSWAYLDSARLLWALQNDDTISEESKKEITDLLDQEKPDINEIHKMAKKYTPSVTKIFNIEFQCMRDMSKSFQLIPRNNGYCKRVLDYLDNYELIYEYLTRVCMRLVRTDQPDSNKARRDNCRFWEAMRNAKTVDMKRKHKDLKLIRKYNSNVNLEIRKKRAISALSSYGYCLTQNEDGNLLEDASNLLSVLNDNDLEYIDRHKKKLASRNEDDIPDEQKPKRSISYYFFDPDEFQ